MESNKAAQILMIFIISYLSCGSRSAKEFPHLVVVARHEKEETIRAFLKNQADIQPHVSVVIATI